MAMATSARAAWKQEVLWAEAPVVDAEMAGESLYHVAVDISDNPELMAGHTIPGQFVQVRVRDSSPTFLAIASPSAVCSGGRLEFLVKDVEGSTAALICNLRKGDTVELSQALGNGCDMSQIHPPISILQFSSLLRALASVLSAVQGIQAQISSLSDGAVVGVSAVILLLLFLLQRFGTGKVSFLFSPITIVWFVSNAIIGVYNIIKYYPAVFKAISRYNIVRFFGKNGKHGWVLLGGTVLSITGSEAMFADLGHFNRSFIQIAFSTLVYPAPMLTYSGQAAYLINNPDDISRAFYNSLPKLVYWPMFVLATAAAIVASQALISATFSIIKQSMALSCFPRVKIVQTSRTKEGRIYSPEINHILMFLCLAVLLGFQSGSSIGNAYGVPVITVMLITTCLVTLVMLVVWNLHILLILPPFIVYSAIEVVYLSAVLNKVPKGGWVPIVISGFFLTIMFSWNYGRHKKYKYAMEKKLHPQDLHGLVSNVGCRVPGICHVH